MRGWLHPVIQTTVARFARKNRQRAILPACGQGEAWTPDEHWFHRKQGRGGLCVDQVLSCCNHSSFALASQGLPLRKSKFTMRLAGKIKFIGWAILNALLTPVFAM